MSRDITLKLVHYGYAGGRKGWWKKLTSRTRRLIGKAEARNAGELRNGRSR